MAKFGTNLGVLAKRGKLFALLALLLMTGGFIGRAFAQSNGVIGVVLMAEDNPFFVALGNGVATEAKVLGYSVNIQNGQYSDQIQLREVQSLVNAGAKGIIFEPYENVPSKAAVKYAVDQGVPVITADSPSSSPLVKSFVATDNYAAGQQIGQWFAKAIGYAGSIVVLNSQASGTVTQRVNGFMSIIKQHKDIHVVAEANGLGQRPQSLKVMLTILQAHPDIKGVFAINDPSALGAYAALKVNHLENKVVVGSIDGSPAFVNLVKTDPLAAVSAQQPNLMGGIAMKFMNDVFNGKSVPTQYLIAPILVDHNNWQSYNGWH